MREKILRHSKCDGYSVARGGRSQRTEQRPYFGASTVGDRLDWGGTAPLYWKVGEEPPVRLLAEGGRTGAPHRCLEHSWVKSSETMMGEVKRNTIIL